MNSLSFNVYTINHLIFLLSLSGCTSFLSSCLFFSHSSLSPSLVLPSLLLSFSPFQNKLGDTPLHNAAWKGHHAIVELLLDKGANRMIRNNENQLPYDLGAKHPEVGRLLKAVSGMYMYIGASFMYKTVNVCIIMCAL